MVGTLERIEDSLKLAEKMLPQFFTGIVKLFRGTKRKENVTLLGAIFKVVYSSTFSPPP